MLLIAGITFHALIAIDMGLVSFFAAMTGALLLYLLPVGHQLTWPRWATGNFRRVVGVLNRVDRRSRAWK